MSTSAKSDNKEHYLGIETGGTRTTVLKVDSEWVEEFRRDYEAANLRLVSEGELLIFLEKIKGQSGEVSAVAVGMAGLRTSGDRDRVLKIAKRLWPDIPVLVTSDMDVALASVGDWAENIEAQVLLLSGTGSFAYGVNKQGRKMKFGGRGHILGDQGSACDIALKALRAVVYQYDLDEHFPGLGQSILRVLQLNHPDDLISWSQEAGKQAIAQLAMIVFEEAVKGDALAQRLISDAAQALSDMALHCAGHLAGKEEGVKFIFAGGTLLKQPHFASLVSQHLQKSWPLCQIEPLKRESAWGAIALARSLVSSEAPGMSAMAVFPPSTGGGGKDLDALADAPTERRNPLSTHLDTMSLDDAIELMVEENIVAIRAILDEQEGVKWLIEQTVRAFQSGGRLFYAGAGTSGRLGILDASECPPTFRVSSEQVQGIMAGGNKAIWSAVEGAEDKYLDGADAVRHRGVRQGDVLLGIASSGRTPFVLGAIAEAKRSGAITCLLCFNPGVEVASGDAPDRIIAVNTGPEVLTGSTRLKAGTATKVILNTLTTLAMVRTGKVMGNLMVDLNASNDKLRQRAIRIVREITGCDAETAVAALKKKTWGVRNACLEVSQRKNELS